jgi:hypothetical protein
MGIIRKIFGRFLFFFSGSRAGVAGQDDQPPLDPDREYLVNLHCELERSGRIAIILRGNQPAVRSGSTCPLREITILHRTEVPEEITLPDTRILPMEDLQEIVMAEIGQES